MEVAMARIFQVRPDPGNAQVRELFWEYLAWANGLLASSYGISLDVTAMLEDDMHNLDKFGPPAGRLLLAGNEGMLAGCACLRKIGQDIGELKRMYVRPGYRRQGIGRALLDALLDEARLIGYRTLRLDSVRFMREAHSLYQAAGFRDVAPYPESEIPEAYRQHWVFMEMALPGPATAFLETIVS
jgi:GNAT superfamily N-acetyltransferase